MLFTDASHRLTQTVALTTLIVSAATIGGAFVFEYAMNLAPCPLCLWQRPAYYVGMAAGALLLLLAGLGHDRRNAAVPLVLLVLALGFAVNSGLGVYHAGVEWKWWAGPAACAGGAELSQTSGDLLAALDQATVVRCDEAPWRDPLGVLSLAGYNALISAGLSGLAGMALYRRLVSRRSFA